MFNQIMLVLSVEQPIEAVLLPGILDGLSGRLGMTPPGVVDQPFSAREGVSWQWAAALREAVMMTEGEGGQPGPDHSPFSASWAPPGLRVRFLVVEG